MGKDCPSGRPSTITKPEVIRDYGKSQELSTYKPVTGGEKPAGGKL